MSQRVEGWKAISSLLASLGLSRTERWCRWASSPSFPGEHPLPVVRVLWGKKPRVWADVAALAKWAAWVFAPRGANELPPPE